MKKTLKAIVPAVLSIASLLVSDPSDKHVCSTKVSSYVSFLSGISISRNNDIKDNLIGLDASFKFMRHCCGGSYMLAFINSYIQFDSYFQYNTNPKDTTGGKTILTVGSDLFKVDNSQGIYSDGAFLEVALGKNICISKNDSHDIRHSRNCECSHFNVGIAGLAIRDTFAPNKSVKVKTDTKDRWTETIAKDICMGVNASYNWRTTNNFVAVIPEISLYAQVWNSSIIRKNSDPDKTASLTYRSLEKNVKRNKLRPVITCRIPIYMKIKGKLNTVVVPAILWTKRTLKDNASDQKLIEDRIKGSISIGCSYSRR